MKEKSKFQLKSFKNPLNYASLAIILFALLTSNSFGQWITWQKIYNGPSLISNDYGYASCRADGQNMYILGSISNQRIYLLKINQYGDTLWTKIIGNSLSRGRAIVESDSGSCVLTGDIENGQAFAVKVDKNGSILWQKYYGGVFVQINDIIISSDFDYVLCGVENTFNAIVLKINSNGDLQWYRNFSAGYEINLKSIIECNSGDYLLTGWKSDNINSPAKCLIQKIDLNGIYIWDTVISINSQSIGGRKIIRSGNGYAICGTVYNNKLFFIRMNEELKVIHYNMFDSTYQKYDIGGIVMMNPNKFLMNFSQDSVSGLIDGKIAIFDSLGNILKYKTYTPFRQITFGTMIKLNDTGFVFCGTIDNNQNSGRDIYVIKTDTLLNSNPPIGIHYINNLIPTEVNMKIYPNPFNPETNFSFDLKKSNTVKIVIYDMRGKVVNTLFNAYLNGGEHAYKWVPDKLSSGIYFAVLYLNNILSNSFKIIFIK